MASRLATVLPRRSCGIARSCRPIWGRGQCMLKVENIQVSYGRVPALWDVSFTVPAGEIVALVGANGAGKTTTLRTISGLLKPQSGKITFQGDRFDGRTA